MVTSVGPFLCNFFLIILSLWHWSKGIQFGFNIYLFSNIQTHNVFNKVIKRLTTGWLNTFSHVSPVDGSDTFFLDADSQKDNVT